MSTPQDHASPARRPAAMTRGESHDRALELFQALPPGSVLDVPCGRGALAARLKEMGFAVQCCDIIPALFELKDVPIKEGNLNRTLPYETAQFDYVASIAGLHRVHSFRTALSEFHRVLKPGGRLVLSFPNYANIERRLRFLLCGSVSNQVNQSGVHESPTGDADAAFRQMLVLPQVCLALESIGFRLERVLGDKLKLRSLVLLPLGLPPLLCTGLAPRAKREKYCLKWTDSAAVLFGGNNVILVAQKGG